MSRTIFDLHVIRDSTYNVVYEDTINHLSESEREMVGLVFALAGHLTHYVHEVVPIMLLDSLEAIDSQSIASLVESFEAYVDCFIVSLLPEDAEAVVDQHEYVRTF